MKLHHESEHTRLEGIGVRLNHDQTQGDSAFFVLALVVTSYYLLLGFVSAKAIAAL